MSTDKIKNMFSDFLCRLCFHCIQVVLLGATRNHNQMYLLPDLLSGRIDPMISIVTISNGSFSLKSWSACVFSGLD